MVRFVRKRIGAVVAVLLLAFVAVCVAVQGRFAAGSQGDVRAAQADGLWARVPVGIHETSRFAVRADAAWVPWPNNTTFVGRYYLAAAGTAAPPLGWDVAARSAGWKAVPGRCGPAVKVFAKALHAKPARLTVKLDPTKTYVLVVIRFGQTPGSDARCGD